MSAITGARLTCPFCQETSQHHDATESDLARMMGLYITHLVMSHWDKLEQGRQMYLTSGGPDNWSQL